MPEILFAVFARQIKSWNKISTLKLVQQFWSALVNVILELILAMQFSYNPKAMSKIPEVEQIWLVDFWWLSFGCEFQAIQEKN